MKRMNRTNFIIFVSITIVIQILLMVGLSEILDEGLYWLETVIFISLIGFIIFGWVLISKRSHDFSSRGGKHIVGSMLIPFYILYVAFKKGDNKTNKYGDIDSTLFFMRKDSELRSSIVKYLYYIFLPFLIVILLIKKTFTKLEKIEKNLKK